MICEAGYTPEEFRHMTVRDAVSIFRGFKRRAYESYRVAAFHIYYMAQMTVKNPRPFHPDRIQPPYELIGLTSEQRRELETARLKELSREHMRIAKKKK